MRTALEICHENTATARAVEEDKRAQLRADFPEFAVIVAELAAPDPRPGKANLPAFKPRVLWMCNTETGKRWERDQRD